MAFNFNWTPLTTKASSAFYDHAKSLLTQALNKPSKPPIIVDDIFVEELNLGQSAPELEILEIGDLAEDRFQGIFRMSYDGDAFLTLRTKVQVNPLNTYLSTTPSYTSPNPLAASSPLTIPLQITLSDFRLSGFVILVFSKAKGITIVFRNDPLDSLRVSSTFDSIPFIKDYLQTEIERQVRGLFQEELPVAIHRLSLRLWNPEYAASLDQESTVAAKPVLENHYEESEADDESFVNPLLTSSGDSDSPTAMFSQKNMLKLSSLMDSRKTLSLFTPNIRDAIFRCWASGAHSATVWDRMGSSSSEVPGTPSSCSFSDTGRGMASPYLSRPQLHTASSTMSVGHMAPGRRKKKHRVVNLRQNKASSDMRSETDDTASATTSEASKPTTQETETLKKHIRRQREDSIDDSRPPSLRFHTSPVVTSESNALAATQEDTPIALFQGHEQLPPRPASPTESVSTENITYPPTAPSTREYSRRDEKRPQFRAGPKYSSGILEKAFMAKLAGEMQRRIEEERIRKEGGDARWGVERELERLGDEVGPPPAYT